MPLFCQRTFVRDAAALGSYSVSAQSHISFGFVLLTSLQLSSLWSQTYCLAPCVPAGIKWSRTDATWPTFSSLALSGQPGISLVGTCCRQVSWPSPREALGTSALVVQSDLQAALVEQNGQVVAWVTTTQGQSKAVEGARVQVYATMYGKVSACRCSLSLR